METSESVVSTPWNDDNRGKPFLISTETSSRQEDGLFVHGSHHVRSVFLILNTRTYDMDNRGLVTKWKKTLCFSIVIFENQLLIAH